MKSMTGFGRAESVAAGYRIAVEIKAYNSRYLELNVSLPADLGELEPRLRGYLAERVGRGRVELSVGVVELEGAARVSVDAAAARSHWAALHELAELVGAGGVDLSHLLAVGGFLRQARTHDPKRMWAECQEPLERAFAQFEAERRRDGANTTADLERLVAAVEADVAVIAAEAPLAAERMRAAMTRKTEQLLAEPVDDGRVVAALAVVLARADVNEELVRLRGHLQAFREALAGGGVRAKQLEFLNQELMREANTIAAKGAAYAIGAAAVRARDAIERMREHLRNLE